MLFRSINVRGTYSGGVYFRPNYCYKIGNNRILAPLVWPYIGDFYAVGTWAELAASEASNDLVRSLEERVTDLAVENGWRRYLQSEYVANDARYGLLFGALYETLDRLAAELDPDRRFNRRRRRIGDEPICGDDTVA